MTKIHLLSSKHEEVDLDSAIKKYLSKKVFTKDGEHIGKVIDVVIKDYQIIGMVLAKAMFFNKHFIDTEYIDTFTPEGIILKINPVTLIIGKQVFDSDGKMVGKVKSINRKSNANSYESIIVKEGIFRKARTIYPKDISITKKNIILKIPIEK